MFTASIRGGHLTVKFLLACLVYLFAITKVRGEWVRRTLSPTAISSLSYTAITWPDNDVATVLAVGAQTGGAIIRSTDYGVTFSQVASSISFSPMYGIASRTISGTTYYIAVDDAAEVFTSTGTGVTWSLTATLSGASYGVTIGSNGNAYVSGGTAAQVYRSSYTSGFATWTLCSPTTSGTLYGISSFDGTNVIAVGSTNAGVARIYYSSNSGSSWTQATGLTTTSIVYCVAHGSSSFALAAGLNSYVARTTNGGATWTTLSVFSASTVTIRYQALSVLSSTGN